jgi:signal transduction histidine kinase
LKILVSSGKMLRLFISDINDFERIKTHKMVKNITSFDLRETINEVILMQDFDALKKEIKIEL